MTSDSFTIALDIQQQIDHARKMDEVLEKREPRAKRAWFNPVDKTIEIELKTGVRASFPVHLLQGLQGATSEQLAEVEISPSGYGLYWESLDADLVVPTLMSQIFGSRAWPGTSSKNRKVNTLTQAPAKLSLKSYTSGHVCQFKKTEKCKESRKTITEH
ncbi:DUF2442 domain-containing protein [Thermosynechococcaceae cyanobacterium BACA0444]|uniref:DUF2442 domain-containing protein n=1 Tax=Pseudocalidococcus azoricus BACA0444 TaxID=2918990 RepID=A0AAE4FRV1_9CYAN|nr:DUF2442 domain-containing protein [Pseudocalidococcus azoricus]MDS3860544.1 DUF2442 domain-containing protein [Pseudocalidococcus azoricus BACA0444]